MHWFTDVITKQYAQFSGRARRKEFWMFILFSFVISVILGILDSILGLDFETSNKLKAGGVLQYIFALAVLVPTIAISVRRFHDRDKGGWWVLIYLIPCVGWIWFIVWAALEGTVGDNRFGPDPKAAERGGPGGFAGPGGSEPGYPTV
ncbi:DUF805 domain-containing protein [Kribbella antibiotica]|uniref:DUF805 domain-containing protein n=1 Tax=Kribbella antibiotica TaxID=190195 RepID=A0A4R4ZBG2_9ACTN|nr:DUF805 domain-containing protein [Kribbella antibiotica]TDD55718.1 DUF805 domain-containing protein [Kribbella antibiotica]